MSIEFSEWHPRLAMVESAVHPVNLLQERYHGSGTDTEYRVRRLQGADHLPMFEAVLEVPEGLQVKGLATLKMMQDLKCCIIFRVYFRYNTSSCRPAALGRRRRLLGARRRPPCWPSSVGVPHTTRRPRCRSA